MIDRPNQNISARVIEDAILCALNMFWLTSFGCLAIEEFNCARICLWLIDLLFPRIWLCLMDLLDEID